MQAPLKHYQVYDLGFQLYDDLLVITERTQQVKRYLFLTYLDIMNLAIV